MKFIDEVIITVQSGKGGGGCVSFRREKFIERGGPDGGDGGDGGDVIIKATERRRTLYQYRHKKNISAQNGAYGEGSQRHGKDGDDIILEVPPGTVITDVETGEVCADLQHSDDTFIAAKGGRGGKGNKFFATSRNQVPRHAQPGEPGQTFELKLELKLLADVGLIGFPNAGKSTLISVISSARPKIGNYPFTTITPNLGMVQPSWGEPFAVADIPGLIEGAHAGVGLGTKFLRHIERTRVLVHLIDASEIDPEDPLANYNTINKELALYSEKLAEKEQILVINKVDITETSDAVENFINALPDREILLISAATTQGVEDLKAKLANVIGSINEDEQADEI